MLVAMKINGVYYQALLNYKGEIVYKEEITETKFEKFINAKAS